MIEIKRELLHGAIEKYGLDYEKVIEADRALHEDIIKKQREILKGVKPCLNH